MGQKVFPITFFQVCFLWIIPPFLNLFYVPLHQMGTWNLFMCSVRFKDLSPDKKNKNKICCSQNCKWCPERWERSICSPEVWMWLWLEAHRRAGEGVGSSSASPGLFYQRSSAVSKGWELEKHQGLLWLPAVSVETQPAWQCYLITAGGFVCLCAPVCFSADTVDTEYQPLALLLRRFTSAKWEKWGKANWPWRQELRDIKPPFFLTHS